MHLEPFTTLYLSCQILGIKLLPEQNQTQAFIIPTPFMATQVQFWSKSRLVMQSPFTNYVSLCGIHRMKPCVCFLCARITVYLCLLYMLSCRCKFVYVKMCVCACRAHAPRCQDPLRITVVFVQPDVLQQPYSLLAPCFSKLLNKPVN